MYTFKMQQFHKKMSLKNSQDSKGLLRYNFNKNKGQVIAGERKHWQTSEMPKISSPSSQSPFRAAEGVLHLGVMNPQDTH